MSIDSSFKKKRKIWRIIKMNKYKWYLIAAFIWLIGALVFIIAVHKLWYLSIMYVGMAVCNFCLAMGSKKQL